MLVKERLLECKIKLGIKSDYELASKLDVTRQRVNELMSGRCKADSYVATRIAEVLGLHPLMILAEFEAETAKDEKRRGYWLDFVRRIKSGVIGMLALICIALWPPESRACDLMLDTHNVYYVKLQAGTILSLKRLTLTSAHLWILLIDITNQAFCSG